MARRLLIVSHSQTGGTAQLVHAALNGAMTAAPQLGATAISAAEVNPSMVSEASGLIVATPEYFGYMSGIIKDFFDRCFYPCEGVMTGKPYAFIVCAGNDGSGAMNAMERIIAGWRMQRVHTGLIARRVGGVAGSHHGHVTSADLLTANVIGATLAAGLDAGIY